MNVYSTKKLLNYAAKNKDLMLKKIDEKVHIIDKVVPKFSCQFITIPIAFFEIFVDISFVVFNLYFLINSYHLSQLVPLLVVFILVNLAWFTFFYYFFSSLHKDKLVKKSSYQVLEKSQIKNWLESLQFDDKTRNSNNLPRLLDNNSQKITNINFLSALYQMPELIISGISILFLFLYYQFYCGGKGSLSWGIYFMANHLQTIFLKVKRGYNLLSTISSCQENYQKIEGFFS